MLLKYHVTNGTNGLIAPAPRIESVLNSNPKSQVVRSFRLSWDWVRDLEELIVRDLEEFHNQQFGGSRKLIHFSEEIGVNWNLHFFFSLAKYSRLKTFWGKHPCETWTILHLQMKNQFTRGWQKVTAILSSWQETWIFCTRPSWKVKINHICGWKK